MSGRKMAERLDAFRLEIMQHIAINDVELRVVDDEGRQPVVVALDEERLAVLLRRVQSVGGYATVFSAGPTSIRRIAVLDETGALDTRDALNLVDIPSHEQPSGDATVGMFLDLLVMHPGGVRLPAALSSDQGRQAVLPPQDVDLIGAR